MFALPIHLSTKCHVNTIQCKKYIGLHRFKLNTKNIPFGNYKIHCFNLHAVS